MGVTEKNLQHMSFEEYTILITEKLEELYGEDYKIRTSTVLKNNNRSLVGVTIGKKEDKISPTIYLETFYEKYMQGDSIEDSIRDIIQVSEENQVEEELDFSFFESYEKVSKHIVFKLINYDKNQKLLEDIPHIKYLNLAIVFYYTFVDSSLGNASILIHNTHLDLWNVSLDTIYQDAISNAPILLKAKIRNMKEIMLESFHKEYLPSCMMEENINSQSADMFLSQILDDMFALDNFRMYVLTNEVNSFGAACLLYRDLLKNFAHEIGQGFYVLPSSVHEIIMVPENEVGDGNGLLSMVKEVNVNEVAEEEILADNVYYYDYDIDELIIYA